MSLSKDDVQDFKRLLQQILDELKFTNSAMQGDDVIRTPTKVVQDSQNEKVLDVEHRIATLGFSEYFRVVEEGDEIHVVSIKFLKDGWNDMANMIKELGGRYVSRAENSHPHFVLKR